MGTLGSSEPTGAGKPRLFLTGGSGYIGRNLIRNLSGRYEIVALVRSTAAAELVASLGALPYISELISDDLTEAMRGCEVMVHAAADTGHGPAMDAQRIVNVEGTRAVFLAARRAHVARSVLISTESVLLDGRALVGAREDHAFPRAPIGGYSRTKGEAETIALSHSQPEMAVMIIRPRFVWGRDDTTALPQLVQAVRSGRFAWIGGGRYRTSTTHVDNLCHGLDLVIDRGRKGEIYFITDGDPVEFRSFATDLLATQGLVPPDKSIPRALLRVVALIGDRLGRRAPINMQTFATSAVEVTLNIDKARMELGYSPRTSREAGLAEMRRYL